VSDYYDLFLALELRGDLPDEVIREVRWHLGLTDDPPARFEAFNDDGWFHEKPYSFFPGTGESRAFPGADVTALVRSSLLDEAGSPWELTVRSCVHEDEINYAMELIVWLATQSTTEGWVGYLGHTQDTEPRHMYHRDGTITVD
jgi:hypothetical protein